MSEPRIWMKDWKIEVLKNTTSRNAYYAIHHVVAGLASGPGAKPEMRHFIVKNWGGMHREGQFKLFSYYDEQAERAASLFETIKSEKISSDYLPVCATRLDEFNCGQKLNVFQTNVARQLNDRLGNAYYPVGGNATLACLVGREIALLDFSTFRPQRGEPDFLASDHYEGLDVHRGEPNWYVDRDIPLPTEALPIAKEPESAQWGAW